MQSRLQGLKIELSSLQDMEKEGYQIPTVWENGTTPLENARCKASAYYKAFGRPVFSCDSGLYFDEVPDELQPGVHVRNVNGKCLSDEEMREYYGELVKTYGELTAHYQNAICLILDKDHIYESMDSSMESKRFRLTAVPHSAVRKQGFPLDGMSIDLETGKYFYDLPEEALEKFAFEDSVLTFFASVLSGTGDRFLS